MCRFEGVEGGGHRRSALAFVREAQDEQHDNNSEEVLVRHAILISVLLVTGACASQQATTSASAGTRPAASGNVVGAASSRAAVESFLDAAKDADLQRMGTLWGDEKSLARDRFSRDEYEKRLVILQCLLQHDKWNFTESGPRLEAQGHQIWPVRLTRKKVTVNSTLTTARNSAGRWFVSDADAAKLQPLCT
jgi:hypothetical protein